MSPRERIARLTDAQAALLSAEDRLRREGGDPALRARITRRINALGLQMAWLEAIAREETVDAEAKEAGR